MNNSIDVDSLAPDPRWTPTEVSGYHQSLFKTWQRIGILKHDTDKFETSRLYQAIRRLPQKIRPQWEAILKNNPLLLACGNEWNGDLTPKNINQLDGIVQVAIIDDTRAEVDFGLSEEQLSSPVRIAPSIEICRISAVEHAKTFEDAIENKSNNHIKPKEKYTDIWKQRFKSLACAPIKHIVIVDRYSIGQLFNPPPQQLSGLDRFLRLLDMDASGLRHITLYSSWADLSREIRMPQIEENLNLIMSKLQNKKINSFKVIMLPNGAFGRLSHDRFIRFGNNFVWEIGIGLKIFEGPFTPQRSSATFKTGSVVKEFIDIEDELKKNPEAQYRQIQL